MTRWRLEYSRNRQLAIANGDETYQGHPCKHGHPGIRMTRYHGKCFDCHQGKNPYYGTNREQVLARQKQKRIDDPARYLLAAAKARARASGRDFDLQLEDIKIPERCPISGRPLVINTADAPSVDRIDNNRGYVKGNVAVISKRVNAAKHRLSLEEVLALADYMQAAKLLA